MVGCLLSKPAFAANDDAELQELLGLNLEELTVSVASKKTESISDAPSIISVVTRKEIDKYGGRNLLDVLNRIPSFQYTSGLWFQNNTFSARGQSIQHYSNRMLFLINGRPFRDSLGGGYNMPLFADFPVSTIEKIEVIRGPGSVLYGSNAFSAVINIVTRKAEKEGETFVSGTYGSYDYYGTEVSSGKSGEDWDVLASYRGYGQDGEVSTLFDEAGNSGSFQKDDLGRSMFASTNYKGFSLNSFFGESKQSGFLFVHPLSQNGVKRTFLDVGYKHDIGKTWQVSGNITQNRLEFNGQPINDIITELSASGKLTDNLHLLVGSSYERQRGRANNNPRYDLTWWSNYSQLEYTPVDWLKLVAGVQMNKPENVKKDFSPRFAAVANFNKNWGAKLLYGKAFRSGYALETVLDIGGIILGNASLQPEVIATSEAQLFYHDSQGEASVTFYHSNVSDIIKREPAAGGGLTYINGGEVIFRGIELEGKISVTEHWSALGSLTWQENEDDAGVGDVTYTPNLMAKIGVAYDSPRGYSIGVFNNYFGTPSQVREFDSTVLEVNPEADSYNLMTANAEFNINKLTDWNDMNPIIFSIFADNLLDEDIYYPEYNRENVNSYPISSGRAVYGTVKVKF